MNADPLPRPGNVDRGAAATVTVYPDGPLILRGDFEVREVDGTVVRTSRVVALCRCGRSALKPVCDGSHKHRAAADRATARTRADAVD
jgi:CDGSH-type Zn-finger protein